MKGEVAVARYHCGTAKVEAMYILFGILLYIYPPLQRRSSSSVDSPLMPPCTQTQTPTRYTTVPSTHSSNHLDAFTSLYLYLYIYIYIYTLTIYSNICVTCACSCPEYFHFFSSLNVPSYELKFHLYKPKIKKTLDII